MIDCSNCKKDCEFFRQHYTYNYKHKRLHEVNCFHCVKPHKNFKAACEKCPHYKKRIGNIEEGWFTLSWRLDFLMKEIEALKKLAAEIKILE